MSKIVLISCVSKKRNESCKARDLYISDLFKKALYYSENVIKADKIFVLSAKYGLVSLDEIIEPYDKTLNKMKKGEVLQWSDMVLEDLKNNIDIDNDKVIFMAGLKYRKYIESSIKNVEVPMRGMKIGQQLQFLKRCRYE